MKTKAVQGYRTNADFWGVVLSVLCLIHCLIFPLLIAFAPALLRKLPGDDTTHRIFMPLIALVGWFAFRSGYRQHRKRRVLFLFLGGITLISVAALLGETVLSATGETLITVSGSLLMVVAHLANRSFCRTCAVQGCEHHFHFTPESNMAQPTEE